MVYGLNCIFSPHIVVEFRRYRLERFRVLTGLLQILGSTGLLLSFVSPFIGMIAAVGLTVLMLLGFCVRLKIRDSALQASPSFIFMLINPGVLYYGWLAKYAAAFFKISLSI